MNTKNIFVTVVAAIVLAACVSTPTQESTGEYIDDATITTKVKTRLLSSKETSGTAISVETYKGSVQLSGFVDSEAEKHRAGEIAAAVKGVKEVENKLTVKSH